MSLGVNISKKNDNEYVVSLEGSLGTETYIEFIEKIKPVSQQQGVVVILDLEGLDYISSIGIGILFRIQKTIEEKNGQLIITKLQPQVQKIFDIVKAFSDGHGHVFKDMKEVDEYLKCLEKGERGRE